MLFLLAFVLGVLVGRYGQQVVRRLTGAKRSSDPDAALKLYQKMKESRGG